MTVTDCPPCIVDANLCPSLIAPPTVDKGDVSILANSGVCKCGVANFGATNGNTFWQEIHQLNTISRFQHHSEMNNHKWLQILRTICNVHEICENAHKLNV